MSDDPAPRRREPAFNIPGVIVGCCAVFLGIHAIRALISEETDYQIVAFAALMPARFALALHIDQDRLSAIYRALSEHNPVAAQQIAFLVGEGGARWWTLITYAFLHGSWTHVGFNCLWLVAFGSSVARRFRAWRFLLLLAVSAVLGGLVYCVLNIASFAIVIGASAAVSGAMGAATRFVFPPTATPIQVRDRIRLQQAYLQPALTLRQTFTNRTSLLFILIWFATNLLVGYFPALGGLGGGPIAWQAHIGGFLAGLILFPLFDPRSSAIPADAFMGSDTSDGEDARGI